MSAPYYTGDQIPLKYTVSDAIGGVNITSCKVTILKPDNTIMGEVDAAVDGNEVSYNIPGNVTNLEGVYRVYFVNILPSGGERTHKIERTVLLNPERWPK